jgi:PHD/YefM family antitoxin component YafN of YafNO toxin-antitoxin module
MDFIPKVKNMDAPVNKETGEENPNFIYSDEEDFESYEDELTMEAKSESFIPQAKAKTIQDDIFEEDQRATSETKERT